MEIYKKGESQDVEKVAAEKLTEIVKQHFENYNAVKRFLAIPRIHDYLSQGWTVDTNSLGISVTYSNVGGEPEDLSRIFATMVGFLESHGYHFGKRAINPQGYSGPTYSVYNDDITILVWGNDVESIHHYSNDRGIRCWTTTKVGHLQAGIEFIETAF